MPATAAPCESPHAGDGGTLCGSRHAGDGGTLCGSRHAGDGGTACSPQSPTNSSYPHPLRSVRSKNAKVRSHASVAAGYPDR